MEPGLTVFKANTLLDTLSYPVPLWFFWFGFWGHTQGCWGGQHPGRGIALGSAGTLWSVENQTSTHKVWPSVPRVTAQGTKRLHFLHRMVLGNEASGMLSHTRWGS